MIKTIDNNFNNELWDSLAIHPLQSWEWGEARQKMGLKVVRIVEFDGNKVVNIFQFTIHNLPLGLKIGYLPRSMYPSKHVLEFLKDFGKKNNLIFIKIEPYERENSKFEIRNSKLKLSPHPLFPRWTIMMDLTKSEEELLKEMKPKTRYNVRLAQKKGVSVKEMTHEEGFEIFQKLYFDTTNRQRYYGHNYNYHKTLFDSLKENIAHILIAFYDGKPLAAYEVFIFNKVLYYTYGGSAEESRNVMAPNLLMWETIKYGKKHGANIFDMWNSLPKNYDASHPWAGFTRFKEGFGGEFVELSKSYDLIVNPILYSTYNVAYKVRELLLKFKK